MFPHSLISLLTYVLYSLTYLLADLLADAWIDDHYDVFISPGLRGTAARADQGRAGDP